MELLVFKGEAERKEVMESDEQPPEYLGWLRLSDVAFLLYSVEEVTTPDERSGAVLAASVYYELKDNCKDALQGSSSTDTFQVSISFSAQSES